MTDNAASRILVFWIGRRPIPYLRALLGLFPAKDVMVYAPAEITEWADVPNAFVTTALREGRVLYGG